MKLLRYPQQGYTLMELLIVIALIALVATGYLLTNWKMQVDRGHDTRRKDDLYKLQAALEHFANDHGCYPPADQMNSCGTDIFASYNMPKLSCDPGGSPYLYILADPSDPCKGYYLYAKLKDGSDPAIARINCNPSCGVAGHPEYNYGVSSGLPVKQ